MNQMPKKSQEFNKVAECLYRNGNRLYHALVKVNGKQIRRSLKTNDLAIAKRRLVELLAGYPPRNCVGVTPTTARKARVKALWS